MNSTRGKSVPAATATATKRRRRKAAPAAVHECRVERYARAVIAGELPACRWVRLACERHLRDLDAGAERGLHFDHDAEDLAVGFFGFLRQSKGRWRGKPLVLEDWQAFIIGSVFGWKRADGSRRFRLVWQEIPRKNGKTTMLAGVAILLAFYDDEGGAEVYCAATKEDQAKILFGEASRMVRSSPNLRGDVRTLTKRMTRDDQDQFLTVIGSDSDTSDGLNSHGNLADEIHAWKSRDLWEVLETGTGAREQPITWAITTAGADRESLAWEQHTYATQVLEGVFEDDSVFAYIAALDEGDDWHDPAVWAKCNPNLGVSIFPEYLAEQVHRASESPARVNGVLRRHFNVWVTQVDRFLDMDVWAEQAARTPLDELEGQACYLGVDLASTADLSSLAAFFPDADGDGGDLFTWHWIPGANVGRRVRNDQVPYDVWAEAGYLRLTDGNVTDYGELFDFVLDELAPRFAIREITFDPFNATQLQAQFAHEDLEVSSFHQRVSEMGPATKELERLVLLRNLRHGGDADPVLRWMANNAAVRSDDNENIMLSRKLSRERIDGLIASVMAIGRALVGADEDEGETHVW